MTAGPEAPHGWSVPSQPLAQPGVPPALALRATVWSRIAAYLIDGSLATLAAVVLSPLAGADLFAGVGFMLIWMLAWILVRVAVPQLAGESPGKLLGGLRTVGDHGEPLGAGPRALREVLLYPFYLIPFAIAADAVAADRPIRRSLRDRMAGTYVVVTGAPAGGRGALLGGAALLLVLACGLVSAALYEPPHSVERQRAEFVKGCTSEGGQTSSCECMFERIHAQLGGRRIDEISRTDPGRLPPDAAAAFDDAAARCGEPVPAAGAARS